MLDNLFTMILKMTVFTYQKFDNCFQANFDQFKY